MTTPDEILHHTFEHAIDTYDPGAIEFMQFLVYTLGRIIRDPGLDTTTIERFTNLIHIGLDTYPPKGA